MIVMYRRDFSVHGVVRNVWLSTVEMRLRAHAEKLGVPFEVRFLKEDDDGEAEAEA